jgi:hypothetical protein
VVKRLCLGKANCTVNAMAQTFSGVDPCPHVVKTLAVAVECSSGGRPRDPGYRPAASASVSKSGVVMWDGTKLVGSHPGITSARDAGGAVAFAVSNGNFDFESHLEAAAPRS